MTLFDSDRADHAQLEQKEISRPSARTHEDQRIDRSIKQRDRLRADGRAEPGGDRRARENAQIRQMEMAATSSRSCSTR
jgi:hypothetical protein